MMTSLLGRIAVLFFSFDWIILIECYWPIDFPNPCCPFNQLRPNAILLYSDFGLLVEQERVFRFRRCFDDPDSNVHSMRYFYPQVPQRTRLLVTYLLYFRNFYFRFLFFRSKFQVYVRSAKRVNASLDLKLCARSGASQKSSSSNKLRRSKEHISFEPPTMNHYEHMLNLTDLPIRNFSKKSYQLTERRLIRWTSRRLNHYPKVDEHLLLTSDLNSLAAGKTLTGGTRCVTMHPLRPDGTLQLVTHLFPGNKMRLLLVEVQPAQNPPYIDLRVLGSSTQHVTMDEHRCSAFATFPVPFQNGSFRFKTILAQEDALLFCSDCVDHNANSIKLYRPIKSLPSPVLKPLSSELDADLMAEQNCSMSQSNSSDECSSNALKWRGFALVRHDFSTAGPIGDQPAIDCKSQCVGIDVRDWKFAANSRMRRLLLNNVWLCNPVISSPLREHQLYLYLPIALFSVWFIALVVWKQLKAKEDVGEFEQQLHEQQLFRNQLQSLLKQKQLAS